MTDISFAPVADGDDCSDLSTDARIALLAACVQSQQAAGFGDLIDLRQVECEHCGAPGFNTGWGVWKHTCGAEIHSDGDPASPCPKASY